MNNKIFNRRSLPAVLLLSGIYTEICFHLLVFGPKSGLFFTILMGAFFGSINALPYACLKEVPGKILSAFLVLFNCFAAAVQFIYFRIFGSLMQLSLLKMCGAVVENFGDQISKAVYDNAAGLLFIFLPFIAVTIAFIIIREKTSKTESSVLLAAGLFVLCIVSSFISFKGLERPNDVFYDPVCSTEYAYQKLGLDTGIIKDMISSARSNAKRSEGEDDAVKRSLDDYFDSILPSAKNEYSGLCSGYNLIEICAESFSPHVIDKDLTPALYDLSSNGIIFGNYYGSFQSITSDGEYTLSLSLYPKLSNNSGATSFESSINTYLPFAIGNILEDYGYKAFAYHNNIGEFYSRDLTHKNLGYDFKSASSGLSITPLRPASDYELFAESLDDYLNSDVPFAAYYMTYSGHNPYSSDNAMSVKNYDKVKDLPYSETVKNYIACNLELEYGLEYLIKALKESGKADKTMIVLTNDHYPYGLNEDEYNELAGKEIDTSFEKYKNSFICYIPGLQQNIICNEYCCTADILPTILNLLGVNFDSRLLAGKDVFSNGPHIAVLENGSFITDSFRYDSSSGRQADSEIKDDFGFTEADYKQFVNDKFTVSSEIIDTNYYAYRFNIDSEGLGVDQISFSDIKNVCHKAGAKFAIKYDLMKADSDEVFGGDRECSIEEFVHALNKISKPEISAENFDGQLTHQNTAKVLYNISNSLRKTHSPNETVLAELKAAHPDTGEDILKACVWASYEGIMNKRSEEIHDSEEPLTRFQAAYYLSNFAAFVLGL